MKKIILTGLLSLTSLIATDYVLQIDNQPFSISTDKTTTIKLNNKIHQVKLVKKDIQKYTGKYISFDYLSSIQPAIQQINPQVSQLMMATPLGSVILVQEYDIGNIPADTIYNIMKQELSADYKANPRKYTISSNKKISKVLHDGTKLEGITYTVHNLEENHIENTTSLYFITKNNKSVFVATVISNSTADIADKNINNVLELFWKTLEIHL